MNSPNPQSTRELWVKAWGFASQAIAVSAFRPLLAGDSKQQGARGRILGAQQMPPFTSSNLGLCRGCRLLVEQAQRQ